jgi:hypothetical protein
MTKRSGFVTVSLILVFLIGGSTIMAKNVDTAAEKAKAEEVIKNSIRWILTKDTLTNKMYFNERSSLGVLEGEINFK